MEYVQITTRFEELVCDFKELEKGPEYERYNEAMRIEAQFRALAEFIDMKNLKCDPLYISNLSRLFQAYADAIWDSGKSKKILSLLEKIAILFPHEHDHIMTYFDSYFQKIPRDKRSLLLKGNIQSGKTAIMILTTLCYLTCDRDVIVVLRNSLDDVAQFSRRFESFVAALKSLNYSDHRFNIASRAKSSPAHACVFVVNYMGKNVKKIYDKFISRDISKAVMITDEADMRNDVKDKEYNRLRGSVGLSLFVSATVQDIFTAKWGIRGSDVLNLSQNPSYRGLEKLQIIARPFLENDDELFWTLCDIAVDNNHAIARVNHPKIVLLNVDRERENMKELFDQLVSNTFYLSGMDAACSLPVEMKNICAILYTGEGIEIFHSSLPNETVRSNMLMKDCLLWLAQNGGVERFPNIVVIAGDMARRGINFACYDEADPANNWHLTHQILLKGSASTCAAVTQACRILGNHGDNIPLKLYCTEETREKLLKSHKLTEAISKVFLDDQNKYCKDKSRTTREVCAELPICRTDKPAKYLKKGEKSAFKWVKEGTEMTILDEEEAKEEESVAFGVVRRQSLTSLGEQFFDHIISNIPRNRWCRSQIFYRNGFSDRQMTCNWYDKNEEVMIPPGDRCAIYMMKRNHAFYFKYLE